MKLVKSWVYVGPNIYAHQPLIRMTLDLGTFADRPVYDFKRQIVTPLLDFVPSLEFVTLDDGSSLIDRVYDDREFQLADLMAQLALALQRQGAATVSGAMTRKTERSDTVDVLFGYDSRDIGLKAGDVARLTLLELIDPLPDEPFHIGEEIEDFVDYAVSRTLGPSSMALVKAADDRGIPWFRLNNDSLIQLGHGRYQRRIEAALTDRTSNIAVDIAKDKEYCIELLRDLGLPVPAQVFVRSKRDAASMAKRIGYPVVVKPVDGNHGRGVSLNLMSEAQVRSAYEVAREAGSGVVVEEMIQGFDHRLLVVDGKLVAAAKRVPAHIIGDGNSTIEELVAEVNLDPRRGVGHENMLTQLRLDEGALAVLEEQGLEPGSVPENGGEVWLRKTANLSTGGTAINVTHLVHPENRIMAERAVKAIGLDIGGVDFLTRDISRSYREIGGAICEVNAGPGVRMHIAPSEGEPEDVGSAVMDMLYPPGAPSSVPIAALTGTNGKTTTARMLAHVLKMAGFTVGQTSTDAVKVDGSVTVKGDMTGPVAASIVLRDPDVDMAVLETARGGILRAGLGYKRCDVGAVLNVSADHLGLGGIDTLEQLARVKRVVVEVADDTAVLNADDANTVKMAHYTGARHICYVTMDPRNALVREHISLGQRAVVLEPGDAGEQIVLYDGGNKITLLWSHLIPATVDGKALHNVQNAMFAAAMAHALGLTPEQIRTGLKTFYNSFFQSPGRMNVYDGNGYRVILDYGHNPAAVQAMVDLVKRLDPAGRRIVCLTCPGDRRDEDAEAIARCVAGAFDTYICHSDDDLRGRALEEVPRLQRAALMEAGVSGEQIEIVPGELDSIDKGMALSGRGDLLLVFCSGVEAAWEKITGNAPVDGESNQDLNDEREAGSDDTDVQAPEGFVVTRDARGARFSPTR